MDLAQSEEHLGVTFSSCSEGLPSNSRQWLEEQTDSDGTTLLMRAAQEGATDCVQLLLMCGVHANESRSIDYEKRRALDFAIKRDHPRVVEILLKWDSIFPDSSSKELRAKLRSMREKDAGIKEFFEERDKFHELVRNGDITRVEEKLNITDGRNISGPKYWVNSDGKSSLYTAAMERKYDVWVFLLSRKFEFSGTEGFEIEFRMGKVEMLYFDRAMGKHLAEFEDNYLFKLLSKSKVRGGSDETRLRIQNIYLEANEVAEAKLLMQCLENDSLLEIVFELDRPDLKCAYSKSSDKVLGVMDPHLHRVYASAGQESYSRVVSTLIHEFCHRVMYIVFMNNGLPYRANDLEMMNAYNKIFSKIMSPENIKKCDPLIQLVGEYDKNVQQQELIVRIPEIITKRTIDNECGGMWNNEFEKELNDFYHNHLEKIFDEFVASNKEKACIPAIDLSIYPALLSKHKKVHAQVGVIEQPKMSSHGGVNYIAVSDLSLAISHIEKSLRGAVTVDLSFFEGTRTHFETQLRRGYLRNLVVVWNKETEFCHNPHPCSCSARFFRHHKEYVTLIIPKDLKSSDKEECVEYTWKYLSKGTKDWILNQHVRFQSSDVTLKDLLEGLMPNNDAEYTLSTVISPKDISTIIQQGTYSLGNDVKSDFAKKTEELLGGLIQSFVSRRTRIRHVDLNEQLMTLRTMNAVFFLNTTKDALKKARVSKSRPWEGVMTQVDDGRHFFLERNIEADKRLDYIQKICAELRGGPKSGAWMYAHFFLQEQQYFVHIHSELINDQRCQLLADEPGTGKSVFVYSKATEEKQRHRDKWIEVVQLTECEEVINKWNDMSRGTDGENRNSTVLNGTVEDFLYQLVNKGKVNDVDFSLNKAIFSLFCQAKERVKVFFDGFDEICPTYKNILSSFLEDIMKNTRVSFVVTTRTNQRVDLEKRLSTFALSFVPLNKEEQVQFLNRQWNCMLNLLPKESREEKIRSIGAKYEAQGYHENEIISLENVGEGSNQNAVALNHYNFERAAEDLIEKGKSLAKDEGYFSEIPLHAHMMATVSFANDLFTDDSLNLFSLYKNLVDTKIKLYFKDRAKIPRSEASGRLRKRDAELTIEILKKFSVTFFLKDFSYMPTDKHIEDMLEVGILVKRELSIEFIHRTFGEYFFVCLLLEEEGAPLRHVLFQRVLLEDGFYKVRDFCDAIMLSEISNEDSECREGTRAIAIRQSLLHEGKECGMTLIRELFHKAISECREGILRYLMEIFKEYLPTVMFMDSNDNSSTLNNERDIGCRNAFDLCLTLYRQSRNLKHIRILRTLLLQAETNNLIEDLGKYISARGIRWTGAYVKYVWWNKDYLKELRWILKFFLKHKEGLKKPLKQCLMNYESSYFFRYASLYDFKVFKSLMDGIFVQKDFQQFLGLNCEMCQNFFIAWASVVRDGFIEKVKRVWEYLESKLTAGQARETFLRMRNESGWNCLFAASVDSRGTEVIQYVWNILRRELREEVLNDYLLESFINVTETTDFVDGYFMDWLESALENKCVRIDVALRVLLSRDKEGRRYMLDFSSVFSHRPLRKLKTILSHAGETRNPQVQETLNRVLVKIANDLKLWNITTVYVSPYSKDGYYYHMYGRPEPIMIEFRQIWLQLIPFGLVRDITLDHQFYIYGLLDFFDTPVSARLLVVHLVILWRKLELEHKYFSTFELKKRIKIDWFVAVLDPRVTLDSGVEIKTLALPLIIPFFFSALLHFLPLDDVADVLIHLLHSMAVSREICVYIDPLLFMEFYNVVNRTSLGAYRRNSFEEWGSVPTGLPRAIIVRLECGDTLLDAFNGQYEEIKERAAFECPYLINSEGELMSICDIVELRAVESIGLLPFHSLQSYLNGMNTQSSRFGSSEDELDDELDY
ncbi:uncharacterized protein LOC124172292 [Ischnura elegans]|uniref:uncharacterized protein LOC124172292 n=1 Tax=Ischnura elegans TaxID=197161 RepID=UPI001ED88243|nr:uncharacterized protein LOC124172292 [Ischnura elegans]XP_046407679.1 uncharacterized protein LOC124172292 [Ischnura elegans]